MKLKINREYAMRHLFVTVLMLALGCWFGYDGHVRYPATPAAELYRAIEGSEAPAGCDLEAFKVQKIRAQYGFEMIVLLVAGVVGVRLLKAYRFDFSFDDDGYVCRGRRHRYSEIRKVDRSQWESKGILRFNRIVLDAWHHAGVREFEAKLGELGV